MILEFSRPFRSRNLQDLLRSDEKNQIYVRKRPHCCCLLAGNNVKLSVEPVKNTQIRLGRGTHVSTK